uniref:G-protein coupled receptors family 1 profile domain-containing protein n=1 Tax=Anopheles dirus TaxID=7168 RepID=A0A182NG29_9DIPT
CDVHSDRASQKRTSQFYYPACGDAGHRHDPTTQRLLPTPVVRSGRMKRRGARAPTPLHYAAVVVAAAALTGAVGHLVTPPLLSRSPITALSLAAHAAADNGSETVVDVGSGSTPEPALDDGRSLLDPLAATITTVNRAAEQTLLTNTTAGSPVASSSGSNGSTSSTLVVDLLSTVATGMVGTIDPADPTTRQLGTPRAMDDHFLIANWQDCVVVILFCLLIVVTVIGNTLVILSVITTRRLRTVTNCFVMSLAVADWLVGIFVMPPAVAVHLMGSWQLGWILCDIWISLDVLLCTASILSLCAISIDRYV